VANTVKQAFNALTPEQQEIVRSRRFAGSRSPDEWLALLGPVAAYDRHADPLVLRPLAEWALVTVADGAVAVEFRQIPYAVEDVRAATKQSGRPYADEWAAQWPATPRP
jgi:hypothetical protein